MCQLPSLKVLSLHGCSELIMHASILTETIVKLLYLNAIYVLILDVFTINFFSAKNNK